VPYPRYMGYLNASTWGILGSSVYLWADGNRYAPWLCLIALLLSLLSIVVRRRLRAEVDIAADVEWAMGTVPMVCRACRGTGKLASQIHVPVKGGLRRSWNVLPLCPVCDGKGLRRIPAL